MPTLHNDECACLMKRLIDRAQSCIGLWWNGNTGVMWRQMHYRDRCFFFLFVGVNHCAMHCHTHTTFSASDWSNKTETKPLIGRQIDGDASCFRCSCCYRPGLVCHQSNSVSWQACEECSPATSLLGPKKKRPIRVVSHKPSYDNKRRRRQIQNADWLELELL